MTYSLEDIKKTWTKFDSEKVFSVLKNGKWEHTPFINGYRPWDKIEGTRARVRPLKDVMEFPEYLEKYGNAS